MIKDTAYACLDYDEMYNEKADELYYELNNLNSTGKRVWNPFKPGVRTLTEWKFHPIQH